MYCAICNKKDEGDVSVAVFRNGLKMPICRKCLPFLEYEGIDAKTSALHPGSAEWQRIEAMQEQADVREGAREP